ncbi:carbamoyltransferase HypF [Sulfurospirillum arcachonense]|uniref:carbamoyltransferase HypF n=1 Tax=Sulfurospirillum arcachonense TaxID=57666 RepID=UPI0006872FC2|nr:carbamoyltransferase HypF [Sulfurospirillum arcachonense]
MIIKHFNFAVEGIVQGVGFRPFIYTLALQYNLNGYVLNDSSGVKISVEGEVEHINSFEKDLYVQLPPLARIDQLRKKELPLENFKQFIISKSSEQKLKYSLVSPDFAMCDDCLNELKDKNNRRYNYFFTNCTNCGPRYSIIKTVPYDRPNTSMSSFSMCEECKKEYENPLDRRYHAQPISCIKCGPTLSLKDMTGKIIATNVDAIDKLAIFIKEGFIVAMKGMGGFHLICDATKEKTLLSLREKKNRPSKPFALMMNSFEMIELYCHINQSEKTRVTSNDRPIVLLKRKENTLSPLIAPFIDRLGVFLAYTPLHVMLLEKLNFPIVATSANKSGEPIITNEDDLKMKLDGVIDYYLDYNRDIVNASDDSVLQVIDGKDLIMRASRGLTPISFRVNSKEKRKILAVGAHQKNAIAFYMNNQVILSPYIGDLDNIATIDSFKKTLETFKKFYNFEPDLIVGDKHPLYESTKWAKSQNIPFIQIQHHYAHILACMFEHNIDQKVLGIAWDGTGYGDDGTIWGGEFFICDRNSYKRVAYFEPFLLLGGDASIKDIKRIALSMILDCEENTIYQEFLTNFKNSELNLLKQIHKKELNSPKCSAVGRLFDMVAVICGVCDKVSYDGESGLILEGLYDETIRESYDFYLNDGVIKYKHTIKEMINDKNAILIASKFMNALVNILCNIIEKYDFQALLSGGVFQNKTLLEQILKKKNNIIFQSKLPINDGSIAIGQLFYMLHNKY